MPRINAYGAFKDDWLFYNYGGGTVLGRKETTATRLACFSRHLVGVFAGFLIAILTVGLTVKIDETEGKKTETIHTTASLEAIADAAPKKERPLAPVVDKRLPEIR